MELSAPAADNLQKQLEGKAVICYNDADFEADGVSDMAKMA